MAAGAGGMQLDDPLYFIVSPHPSAAGQRRFEDNIGPYFYVKFGDGGTGNHSAYHRANPDHRMEVNAGVDSNSVIQILETPTKVVTQKYAKFLEKNLLGAYNQAHGGGSEWHIMRPKVATLTYQQLGTNLGQLLDLFANIDLEKHWDQFISRFETLTKETL